MHVGEIVVLRRDLGAMVRYQCPACRRYLKRSPEVHCPCGATYRRHDGHSYLVVNLHGD